MDERARTAMGLKSWTVWGAGVLLMGNGVLLASHMATGGALGLLGDISAAASGAVGPSAQIGIGAGMIGIRRRL